MYLQTWFKPHLVLFSLSLISANFNVYANNILTSDRMAQFQKGHVVVELGGFLSSEGKRQHIDINGTDGDDYTLTNNQQKNGLFGVGYFFSGQSFNRLQMNYGVNWYYLAKTTGEWRCTSRNSI